VQGDRLEEGKQQMLLVRAFSHLQETPSNLFAHAPCPPPTASISATNSVSPTTAIPRISNATYSLFPWAQRWQCVPNSTPSTTRNAKLTSALGEIMPSHPVSPLPLFLLHVTCFTKSAPHTLHSRSTRLPCPTFRLYILTHAFPHLKDTTVSICGVADPCAAETRETKRDGVGVGMRKNGLRMRFD
jgi:hypothetical protein